MSSSASPEPPSYVVVDVSAVPVSDAKRLAEAIPQYDEAINAGTEQVTLRLSELDVLRGLGFPVREIGPAQAPGPGWPSCYSTLEQVYEWIDATNAANPGFVEVTDIGDSWCKDSRRCITPGGETFLGRDILAMRVTNEAATSPKQGRLWIDGGLHAREIPTVELMMLAVEHVLEGYGHDPQITYLLDHRELYVSVVVNPDGRELVELGTREPYNGEPWYWRKNANTYRAARCHWPPDYNNQFGVDLNRNHAYKWGAPGFSSNPCAETYNGESPVSEPESQAYEGFISSIMPDQRGPRGDDAAPLETTGMMINYHNATVPGKVLMPWGWSRSGTPNAAGIAAIAERYVSGIGYDTQHALYPASGSTRDWGYGELGIPAYVVELQGSGFFTPCPELPGVIRDHIRPIKMALGIADRPYERIRGPEVTAIVAGESVETGHSLTVEATIDDGRAGDDAVSAAEVMIGRAGGPPAGQVAPHPGASTGAGQSMSAADGVFDSPLERAVGEVDTSGLEPGAYYLAVRGKDTNGHWGPIGTRAFTVSAASPRLALGVRGPREVTAGDPITYTLTVTATRAMAPTITLTDRIPSGLVLAGTSDGGRETAGVVEWTIASLPAGGSRSVTLSLATDPSDDGRTVVNEDSRASLASGAAAIGNRVETRVIPRPALSVTKRGPEYVVSGSVLTYTLTISVTRGPAHDVVVTDWLPDGTAFEWASSGGDFSRGEVRWALGTLAPGSSVDVRLAVLAQPTATGRVLVNSDYSVRHARGSGHRGPSVITRVRPSARLYVPYTER